MDIADSLINLEICPRKAFLSRQWERQRMGGAEMVSEAIRGAVIASKAQEEAFGDMAGSTVLSLAETRGLNVPEQCNLYDSAIHYASLADILVSVIRKPDDPAWLVTENGFMSPDGAHLRRFVLVSHWTRDRHYSECRSWRTLYPMSQTGLPMQILVFVIGQERNGKRHSHWTKALRHTIGRTNIRFRRRVGNTSGGFRDSWTEIWREDHDEISREMWLNALLKDDVLRDLCFTIPMPELTRAQRQFFKDLARRKLDKIERMKEKPPLQLTNCDWPVKCQFLQCCHSLPEKEPSEKLGFIQIEQIHQTCLSQQ
jgi:hypothetical protein